MSDLAALIPPLKQIVTQAGDAILEVYNASGPVAVENKSDDSPVTKADYAAHNIIDAGLHALPMQFPVLSEEGGMPDFDIRKQWSSYWLVDPLDGTKEFINKNGEFTVNIALIENGTPVLGLVYLPVKNILYIGGSSIGALKITSEGETKLSASSLKLGEALRLVGSRRHGADALDALVGRVAPKFSKVDLVSMGSSLKICACAEGSADWYPRLALTSEWDTAAAHAVLLAAGGEIYDDKLEALRYNQKENILNPYFHAVADANFNWSSLID